MTELQAIACIDAARPPSWIRREVRKEMVERAEVFVVTISDGNGKASAVVTESMLSSRSEVVKMLIEKIYLDLCRARFRKDSA